MTQPKQDDAQMEASAPKMRWYTLHVYSSMEKSVQKAILERIERSGLQDQFCEVLLPIERVEEVRNGRKYTMNVVCTLGTYSFRWP